MVVFRGPALIGFEESDFATHNEISAKAQPEPSHWFLLSFLDFGFEDWHIGVLCLIGNCLCMAAFLAIQVKECTFMNDMLLAVCYVGTCDTRVGYCKESIN